MKKNESLRDLLVTKLSTLLDMEKSLVKALPKMAKAASNVDLKEGFKHHTSETKNHVGRLEEAFTILGEKPQRIKGEGIRGLLADGEWLIENVKPETSLDASLVRAAQGIEHYEMAAYHGAICWADLLGETEVGDLLEENMMEEIAADETLEKAGEIIDSEVFEA